MLIRERVYNVIESFEESKAIQIWNRYCEADNKPEEYIYNMDMFNEVMRDIKPIDIVKACSCDGFDPNCAYFWREDKNVVSGNSPMWNVDDKMIKFRMEKLSKWITEHKNSLHCDAIQTAMDTPVFRYTDCNSARADAILKLNRRLGAQAYYADLVIYTDGVKYDWAYPEPNIDKLSEIIDELSNLGYEYHVEHDVYYYDYLFHRLNLKDNYKFLMKVPTDNKFCDDGAQYEWILYENGKFCKSGFTCSCGRGCGNKDCIVDDNNKRDTVIEFARKD